MNLHRPVGAIKLSEDARADITRVQEIWTDCRARYGKRGPFLFGAFGAADAMFAPVVHRFRTYAIAVSLEVKTYMETMMAFPAFVERSGARRNAADREA
jgi:glutathione S-transferase